MGRGHSAVRSSSRLVNKEKRSRSRSVSVMRNTLAVAKETGARAASAVNVSGASPREASRIRALAAAQAVRKVHEEAEEAEVSEDEGERISVHDVMTKYKTVGRIVDTVLQALVAKCVAGAKTFDLCAFGDTEMVNQTAAVFRRSKDADGKKMARGIAYPTTISINNVLCNHTPLNAQESRVLAVGDVVKIHLAAHLDGYPVSAATTICVPETAETAAPLARESASNAVAACYYALKALIPQVRPGRVNADLTTLIEQTVATFPGVQLVEGVLSNRTKRWIIDGQKSIISTRILQSEPTQDVEPCTLGENEVWTLDIAVTDAPSCRMQTSETDETNIFRRNQYFDLLRLEAGQRALDHIQKNFGCFSFQCNQVSEPLKFRLGLSVLKRINMVDTFPLLQSKRGSVTARFSATVVVTKKETAVIAGEPVLGQSFGTLIHPTEQVVANVTAPRSDEADAERPTKKRRKDASVAE